MEGFPERRADGGVVRMGFYEVGQVAPPFFSIATMVFLYVAGLELYFQSDFVHFEANA